MDGIDVRQLSPDAAVIYVLLVLGADHKGIAPLTAARPRGVGANAYEAMSELVMSGAVSPMSAGRVRIARWRGWQLPATSGCVDGANPATPPKAPKPPSTTSREIDQYRNAQPDLFPLEITDGFRLPPQLNTDEFTEAWVAFLESREAQKQPLTPLARRLVLKKMCQYPISVSIAALIKSAVNRWKGVFPESMTEVDVQRFAVATPGTFAVARAKSDIELAAEASRRFLEKKGVKL